MCSHYTVQVGFEYAATEDVHRIPEVAHGVPWNRLAYISPYESNVTELQTQPTDLDVLPFVRARRHDLQTAKPVVQERLYTIYTSAHLTETFLEKYVRP